MDFKKFLCVSLCLVFTGIGFVSNSFAQERERLVVTIGESRPTNPPPQTTNTNSRPPLTTPIVVQKQESLVKKTGSSQPTNPIPVYSPTRKMFTASLTQNMLGTIQDLYGKPYRYGSTGPYSYDCSGFVWQVFQNAGVDFERSSARTFWQNFEPVYGAERYKFGTLVFFNRLGHVGIVVNEEGFYHASSSQGITYSKFEGYWGKRIVGFRRIPLENFGF